MPTRRRLDGRCVLAALSLLLSACSVVLPLGDEYSFGDASVADPDAGPDAGPTCTEVPTEAEACADRCGERTVCDQAFSCGGCAGELSCGAANVCGCADAPCALSGLNTGDVTQQMIVDMAVDAMGNVFVAGQFRGMVTFGDDTYTTDTSGRYDIFLVKMSPTGEVLWSRAYAALTDVGATGSDQTVRAIDVDGVGNVVLVGESSRAVDLGGGALPEKALLLWKLDADGAHIFSAGYPASTGGSIYADDLAIDPATQDIVITGHFWGSVSFGGSLGSITAAGSDAYFDIFVTRFNASGAAQYVKRFGDGAEQLPYALAVAGNDVYLAVSFYGVINFGSTATTELTSTTYYSLAVAKLSKNIFFREWSYQYGTEVSGVRLAADIAGNLFLGGSFTGTLDIATPALVDADGETFLVKLDSGGVGVWSKQLSNVQLSALDVGADGSLYVVGYVRGDASLGAESIPDNGTNDAFIARYAPDGTHLWSRVFVAPVGNQDASALAVGTDAVWMGANYEGTVDFGFGSLTTQGAKDVAVTRFAAP